MQLNASYEDVEDRERSATPEAETASPAQNHFREEREELERVLSHPDICRSASLVRFLSFICNKYFEGQTGEIREYSIAVEALGRKESSFDSHVDPIVRVTARSLRKKLRDLYATDWKDHPLQIVLPLGHYVPEFVRPGAAAAQADSADDGAWDVAENGNSAAAESPAAAPAKHPRIPRSTILKVALGVAGVAAIFLAGYFSGSHSNRPTRPAATQVFQWGDPVWSDEFDGSAQQTPDPTKWTYDTGSHDEMGNQGWGNSEVETYCSPRGANPAGCDPRRPNAFLDGNGHLVLRAEREADGKWTSARITTRGLKDFQYGRIEARMKLPVGTGLWPAFWMLGANFATAGWRR